MTEAYIETITPAGLVKGWARNPHLPDPMLLELWLEHERVGAAVAASFRNYLVKDGIGHGHYGFHCHIRPQSIAHGTLELRETGSGTLLAQAQIAPGALAVGGHRQQTVESLLRPTARWTMEDVAAAVDALELERVYATLGAKRCIGMVYRFLLGRWPDEAEYDHYLPSLKRGTMSATEMFMITFESNERKERRINPVSPHDENFPFRLPARANAA